MKRILQLGFIVLLLSFQNISTDKLMTPIEKSNFTELTSNAELIQFLDDCKQMNPLIKVSFLGDSTNAKKIPIVTISSEGFSANKVTVLLMGQQHGNEPSGKEGLLFFIKDIAHGNNLELLDSINLIIIPQCNPYGGDNNTRRNGAGIDLNRDHLLLAASETRLIQQIFNTYLPEFTVDFHEYYPYGENWRKFGFHCDVDIQIGGLTNSNIDKELQMFFYKKVIYPVKKELLAQNYTCSEYLVGNFPAGERLRRSTVDINDGRQSMGITNTLSFIVEGKRGRDSLDLIERRAKSQCLTAITLSRLAYANRTTILDMVHNKRNNLLIPKTEKIAIRMEHFKGLKPLDFTLKKWETNTDTTFIVENYHNKVEATFQVESPMGYLIPKIDTFLVAWLKLSNFSFHTTFDTNDKIVVQYQIVKLNKSVDEELENYFAEVKKNRVSEDFDFQKYLFVPASQLYKYKIVTAFEPQSIYGLSNYSSFNYLIKNSHFPILRVETKN